MTDSTTAVAEYPKVTLESIHAKVANVAYHRHDHLTVCIVTMKNGFFVVGKAAPAHPGNFDEGIGQRLAHEDAIRQIWALEGYLLRERLFEEDEWNKELAATAQPS